MNPVLCLVLPLLFWSANASVLIGKLVEEGLQGQLNIVHSPKSVELNPSAGSIASTEVSHILASALQSSVLESLKWDGIQVPSFFDKPRAVALFTVDGLPSSAVTSAATYPLQLDEMTPEGLLMLNKRESLAEHIINLAMEQSLVLSMSADRNLAGAGFTRGNNTHMATSTGASTCVQVSGRDVSAKHMIHDDVIQELRSSVPGAILDLTEQGVVLKSESYEGVFDLSQVDLSFFMELAVMQQLVNRMPENGKDAMNDQYPDVFLFSISTLKRVIAKYGLNSPQMKVAQSFTAAFVNQLADKLKSLYNDEILLASVHRPYTVVEKERVVYMEKIVPLLDSTQHVEFPFVYGSGESNVGKDTVCKTISDALLTSDGVTFHCSSDDEHFAVRRNQRFLLAVTADKSLKNRASFADAMYSAVFNISLWLLVILVLAIYAFSMVMWNMDPGRDSIIYRLTEQRSKTE